MDTSVICALIAALATIISAICTVRGESQHKRSEMRAERRAHESRLAMDLMYSTCALSCVCAKKLSGMHTNGDVEEAMQAAANAQKEYDDFCKEQASGNFAKV